MTLYFVIAFGSMGFAEKTKAKSSIGGNIQTFFLNKHRQYVIASVIIWVAFLSSSYYILYT